MRKKRKTENETVQTIINFQFSTHSSSLDVNGEHYTSLDTYESGFSQHYPYKSMNKPKYEIYDDNSYKQFDDEGRVVGGVVGRGVMHDDNEVTRSFENVVEADDDENYKMLVKKHTEAIYRANTRAPMYNQRVTDKETGMDFPSIYAQFCVLFSHFLGATTTTLVIDPASTFYHVEASYNRVPTPNDISKWETLMRLTTLRKTNTQ